MALFQSLGNTVTHLGRNSHFALCLRFSTTEVPPARGTILGLPHPFRQRGSGYKASASIFIAFKHWLDDLSCVTDPTGRHLSHQGNLVLWNALRRRITGPDDQTVAFDVCREREDTHALHSRRSRPACPLPRRRADVFCAQTAGRAGRARGIRGRWNNVHRTINELKWWGRYLERRADKSSSGGGR